MERVQTVIELSIFYDGGFERNGNQAKLRAGYKKIAFCPSRGHQWSKTISNDLVLIFKNTSRKLYCPACSRLLKIKKVAISEQGYENEINRN